MSTIWSSAAAQARPRDRAPVHARRLHPHRSGTAHRRTCAHERAAPGSRAGRALAALYPGPGASAAGAHARLLQVTAPRPPSELPFPFGETTAPRDRAATFARATGRERREAGGPAGTRAHPPARPPALTAPRPEVTPMGDAGPPPHEGPSHLRHGPSHRKCGGGLPVPAGLPAPAGPPVPAGPRAPRAAGLGAPERGRLFGVRGYSPHPRTSASRPPAAPPG